MDINLFSRIMLSILARLFFRISYSSHISIRKRLNQTTVSPCLNCWKVVWECMLVYTYRYINKNTTTSCTNNHKVGYLTHTKDLYKNSKSKLFLIFINTNLIHMFIGIWMCLRAWKVLVLHWRTECLDTTRLGDWKDLQSWTSEMLISIWAQTWPMKGNAKWKGFFPSSSK